MHMKLIKDILSKEISNGNINWEKLNEKIHAALCAVDNEFNCLRDNGESQKMKFADQLTFKVKNNKTNEVFCYKIVCPRFVKGNLYAKGLQIGRYDLKGVPYFINSPMLV